MTPLSNHTGKKLSTKPLVSSFRPGQCMFIGGQEVKVRAGHARAVCAGVWRLDHARWHVQHEKTITEAAFTSAVATGAALLATPAASASATHAASTRGTLQDIVARRRAAQATKKGFRKPFSVRSANAPPPSGGAVKSFKPVKAAARPATSTTPQVAEMNVYAVMCTKVSNKKHKSYQDAILILDGKYAVLKDMEGEAVATALLHHSLPCFTRQLAVRREANRKASHEVSFAARGRVSGREPLGHGGPFAFAIVWRRCCDVATPFSHLGLGLPYACRWITPSILASTHQAASFSSRAWPCLPQPSPRL